LDDFGSFLAISTIGKHTVAASFTLNNVLVDLLGTLERLPNGTQPKPTNVTNTTVREEFNTMLNLTNVNATVSIFVALDEMTLGDVRLGTFLGGSTAGNLTCLLSSLYDLQIADVRIHSLDYQTPVIAGLEDPEYEELVQSGLGFGFAAFDALIKDAMPEILRQYIEDYLDRQVVLLLDSDQSDVRESLY
jgi:hypothetical protein